MHIKNSNTIMKFIYVLPSIVLFVGCTSITVDYRTTSLRLNHTPKVISIPIEVITQSQPSPTIIVAHPSDGLSWSRYVQFWGSLIKSWGYNVVLPDSFTPRGYRNKEVMSNSGLVNYYERAEDLEQVATWIQKQPWHKGKIGSIGFSHGGGAINRMSNVTNLISVGVAYYPGCFYSIDYNPKIPVQIHIGDNDTWTTVGRCQDLVELSRNKRNNNFDLNIYAGATHAFDIPAPTRTILNYTLTYDSESERKALELTRKFLQDHMTN
jgi:dienelactone hydrolase